MAKYNAKAESPVTGMPMKILAIALALLLVFGIAWSVVESTGVLQRTTVTLKSEHYTVNNIMLKYFYQTEYANFISQNSYYLSYLGLDTSKSLKTQTYTSDMTWYEYFLQSAINSAKDQMILCEAALAAGRTIGEDQQKDIDEAVSAIKENAKAYNMSVNAYLSSMYGKGTQLSDIEKCLEMSALAQVQYNAMIDSYEWTEEDYNKWAEKEDNLSAIWFADYMSYEFEADFDKDDDDEKKSEARQAAKKLADALAEKKTEKEFFDALVEHEKLADKNSSSSSSTTGDKKEKEYKAEDYTKKGYGFEEKEDLGKWLFNKDRKVNDTTVIYDEDEETYTAYICLATKYRNEYKTVNVRHILISCSSSDEKSETYKKAKESADKILADYLAGEKTAEAFGKLALEHTADGNGEEGGLYENVAKGDMVDEFNDWIYDEARKEGDTGIVKTSYGFHVMYFQGLGLTAWHVTADNGLTTEQYDADYAELEKAHEVSVSLENAYQMEE